MHSRSAIAAHSMKSCLPRILLAAWLACGLFPLTGGLAASAAAQTQEPERPVYVVQEGDTLWSIAARFRISMTDLATTNGIADPSQLVVGARLEIPGLEGIQGELTTRTIGLGENLRSISRKNQIPEDILVLLNHITSPEELYVGTNMVLPLQNSESPPTERSMLLPGESLLELAIAHGKNPWSFVTANDLSGTSQVLVGDVLHMPASDIEDTTPGGASALPQAISAAVLMPERLEQGGVAVIELSGTSGISLTGSFAEHVMSFFPDNNGKYISLQGAHALLDPGLYTLDISGVLPAEPPYLPAEFSFSQSMLVSSGNYPFDPVLTVSPETIDPAVTRPEDAEWAALTATATPVKMWSGLFTSPAPPPFSDCWPSSFGNRRSYNGSEYIYFHSGLDFCGGVGTEILAPADGKVVFAGPLTVRGNATVIDHGWGIYSAYLHQSEILVNVGELVKQGQLIGKVGGTGRVTGPHLHWEVWAGGVQVDPLDWLTEEYP